MITTAFLKTKLNIFSITGSILYGLMCASCPTPEVLAIIGIPLYFISAALFYFGMYVVYSQHTWRQVFKSILLFVSAYLGLVIVLSFLYMFVHPISYAEAGEIVAVSASKIFYYAWFLP